MASWENQDSLSEIRSASQQVCWVVSDGRAGIENQALGLAEAVARERDLQIVVKRATLPTTLRWAPPSVVPTFAIKLGKIFKGIEVGPPDLWIGCGRQAAPLTAAAGRLDKAPFRVQLQNPQTSLDLFDLVIAPEHDELEGPNVASMIGSPHRLTKGRIEEASKKLRGKINEPCGRVVGVIIGGPNKAYGFDEADDRRLIDLLSALSNEGAQLFITTSRRTPDRTAAALRGLFGNDPHTFFVANDLDAKLENPYPGLLAFADQLVVTSDSVNMIGEAALSGRVINIFPLNSKRKGEHKFDRFHQSLISRGLAKVYDGSLTGAKAPQLLDETARISQILIKNWTEHLKRST